MQTRSRILRLVFGPLALAALLYSQEPPPQQGKPIGTATTQGNLILLTLNEGALGKANFFDLAGKTVRFVPASGGYRVENGPLKWDAEFGNELTGGQVSLKNFAFPFSGKDWNSLSVGVTGSIAFSDAPAAGGRGGRGGRGGGVSIGRFDELREAGGNLVNSQPAICVFMKPRMSGQRFVKELPDRVVVTWSLSEPHGNVQDFFWEPTVNKFQAVLAKDGSIEMSYQQMNAKDGIVGVYPMVNAGGAEKAIATLESPAAQSAAAPNLDIKSVKLSAIGGLFLKATLELRGPVPPENDPAVAGLTYHIYFAGQKPLPTRNADRNGIFDPNAAADAEAVWTIQGLGAGRGPGQAGRGNAYRVSGSGVSRTVHVEGNTISVQGVLPAGVKAGQQIVVFADAGSGRDPFKTAMGLQPKPVTLTGMRSAEVDLSAVKSSDGPFPVVYESFHYLSLPKMRDLSCSVIKSLGDKFDMLVYYSDFRVDNQEAGTPSDGPLGGGPNGGAVTGIGAKQEGLASYCTQGRFQWEFIQPVYVNSAQALEYPPAGVTDTNTHNIVTYTHQIGERSPNGKLLPYDYAMSQVGHEMGHRWSAFISAKVGNETIRLGDGAHWVAGLQSKVPFPYQRPTEASAMGGGVWQDNYDGTFTQLDDNYYVPATGWSYLDLYLMGLIAPSEVPDFFILRNLQPVSRDANGHQIYKADRTKLTIQDVIAVEGPRLPDVDHAQKKFNTGMVMVVEHGKKPSRELLERTDAIRLRWMDYWETTTGHRSSMTTEVK